MIIFSASPVTCVQQQQASMTAMSTAINNISILTRAETCLEMPQITVISLHIR